jgi:hypothetical protein
MMNYYRLHKQKKHRLSVWRFLFFSLLLAAFFCSASTAKTNKSKKKRKKRVVIDFQDELLEGSSSNPSIFHLFHKKQMDYGRLIKFRKNFLPEMRRTAREIK